MCYIRGNIAVQVLSTVVCNDLMISILPSRPLNLLMKYPGYTWQIGMIEEICNNIKYRNVANRTRKIIKKLFQENTYPGSINIADGHSSYSSAVDHVDSVHMVVNLSEGFKINIDFTSIS